MAHRTRNSISSCGVYPAPTANVTRRHCSSVASLDYEPQTQNKPRQKTSSIKESQPTSILQYSEIESRYLRPLYDNLHALKSGGHEETVSAQLLGEWKKMIKNGICKLRELFKYLNESNSKQK